MKKLLSLLLIITGAILFTGCSKTTPDVLSPRDQAVKYLVGDGNKLWHLKEVYVNGNQQTLTDAQMKYTLTYTINPAVAYSGTFTDSDGYKGTWKMNSETSLREQITNNPSGSAIVENFINEINDTRLDVEVYNNAILLVIRKVYYAY